MSRVDLDKMREGLVDLLAEELSDVVSGAESDLIRFAETMANNMTQAIALGDEPLAKEIRAQARTLAEANRLRAVEANWGAVTGIIGLTMKSAILTLGALS